MRKTNSWRSAILAFVLCSGLVAEAGFFSRMNVFKRWSRKSRVQTLIVTGNYARSRLLAELAQHKIKQPIILISPEGMGPEQLFFMPSLPEATAFPAEKYDEFVDFLHPDRIVFLGDSRFVPQSYVDKVRGKFPTVVLSSKDWQKNATALSGLIKYRKLTEDYRMYLQKLDAATGGQAVSPGSAATPAAMEEPSVVPQLLAPIEQPAD